MITSAAKYHQGQLLIAMPSMEDERFHRTVILLCAHSSEGAMGLVINRRESHFGFVDLMKKLEIWPEDGNDQAERPMRSIRLHRGGPVEAGRGFVLHTPDYFTEESTVRIDDRFSLTATLDVLRAIIAGNGPEHSLLALGYAGWGPGQLEAEIQANAWLTAPCTPDLVFNADIDVRYQRALDALGVNLAFLSNEAGHA